MSGTYSARALSTLRAHTEEICDVLAKYGATNPRLFGSIARGTAGPNSDIDFLIDLPAAGHGSQLARISGIRMDLEQLLRMSVDVACEDLLKDGVSEAARRQAIAL